MIDFHLCPDSGIDFEYEFVTSSNEVNVGHTFEHNGRTWEVTWCSKFPHKKLWLLMLVPLEN